ncbi:hypothetical protein EIN_274290 [Entamoeba invadens IP1]|uniref:PPM-type phosphatase domain-containing protein n=1 Tax=Entamoeba invadens IP1 TaxID=370355 RepID=A0A0A1U1H4_ENTIV|nr:hypothetical protein EIN_274290 [Entamoeba invadens IP1]ELP87862.1 hypothetical protein EIN_274290 [Entamoeba invadens IP1]|eukprot:XP_004254633.1 hypothetical protein EIN_274290 [Entamoeba invadens IP1]
MEEKLMPIFYKAFKHYIKSTPKTPIQQITTTSLSKHFTLEPCDIIGYDKSFSIASFSTYPIIRGTKHGEPNADVAGVLRMKNNYVFAICDGCGWGELGKDASNIGLNAVFELIQEKIAECKTEKELASLLMDSAYYAHYNILVKSNKQQGIGETTILIGITYQTTKPHVMVLSVGDCQAFIVNNKKRKARPLDQNWCRPLSQSQSCGGWIGSQNGIFPHLDNCYIKKEKVEEGDVIICTTDGVSDNITFVGGKKSEFLNKFFTEKLNSTIAMNEFVRLICNEVITITKDLREFHQNNPGMKRKVGLCGKVDHSTILSVRIESEMKDLKEVDTISPPELKELYVQQPSARRSIRSQSINSINLKTMKEAGLDGMTGSSFELSPSQQRKEFCPTPSIYSDVPSVFTFGSRKGSLHDSQLPQLSPRKSPDTRLLLPQEIIVETTQPLQEREINDQSPGHLCRSTGRSTGKKITLFTALDQQ